MNDRDTAADARLTRLDELFPARLVARLERFVHTLRQRERDQAHGNRRLFLADLFIAQLLAFYQPIVRSLRTLDAFSQTPAAQQVLHSPRLARSSVSDANQVVDSALLQPLLDDLAARVGAHNLSSELHTLFKRLVAVDGTFLRIVGELAWTLRQRADNGKTISKPRLDVQFDVLRGTPRFAILSGRDRSECDAACLAVEPGALYVADKAFFGFHLLHAWLDGGADFVIALNSQIRFTPDDPAAPGLSDESNPNQPGRVLSDRCGRLTGCGKSRPPARPLREVLLVDPRGQPLRLLTSLTDPAFSPQLIGEIYRHRWQIELFFRWLKSCAQFHHAISHSQAGLGVMLYVALIATLLNAITTGRPPCKYTLAAMQWIAAGLTDLESIQPALDRLERERQLARERRQRKREQSQADAK